MTETNDFLGFDPSQLSVFNQQEQTKSQGNPLVYNTNPDLAKDVQEDGIYRSTIKIVYNPFNFPASVIEQQSYGLQDINGWFSVVSSLTIGDKNCPIFKAWKKCHFADKVKEPVLYNQAARAEEGGRALFDKRFARYCVIQVLEDKQQPDKVGKYLFMKLPASIWEVIEQKQHPSNKEKAPIPVMDFLFGRAFELEVVPGPDDKAHPERRNRERSYRVELSEDVVPVINTDGSPILSDAENDIFEEYVSDIKKVWKLKSPEERVEMTNAINAKDNTKEFRKIYGRVLDAIKTVCPNIEEHMSYKEWPDTIKTRVQNWIDVVLAGGDPANTIAEGAITPNDPFALNDNATDASVNDIPTSTAEPAEEESDLPF